MRKCDCSLEQKEAARNKEWFLELGGSYREKSKT